MGRNAFETMYDRVRGKEPVNALPSQMAPWAPSLSGQPIPPDEPDPSYVPTGGPSINKLGSAIMRTAEDPRNAWIGLGPVAMAAKIPKAASKLYHIIDRQTGEVVGQAGSLKRARQSVDKDNPNPDAILSRPPTAVEYIPDTFQKMAAEGRTSSTNRVVGKIPASSYADLAAKYVIKPPVDSEVRKYLKPGESYEVHEGADPRHVYRHSSDPSRAGYMAYRKYTPEEEILNQKYIENPSNPPWWKKTSRKPLNAQDVSTLLDEGELPMDIIEGKTKMDPRRNN